MRKIKRGSASAQIPDVLRDRTVALDVTPGESLSRAKFAAHYGVSQTPVRDAMIRLEEEGLPIIHPQSRTLVSRIDVAHAGETQILRLSLEIEITRRLAQARSSNGTVKAHTRLSLQRPALAAGDIDAFARLDRQCHAALCDAAGTPNLWTIVAARSGHADRLRKLNLPEPGKSASILSCHERILAAIDRGQVAAAETVVRENLSGPLARVDKIMARHPEYF